LTPNAQPTGGSYDLKLFERGHTNSAPGGQQSYIILKRANSASAWTSQGTTIGNSQTAGIPPGTVAVPIYGLTTFSDFGIGFGNTVLPVELTLFTATVSNDDVLLNWRTESELNNHYFDVQRSADGFHFESIGSLEGHGTSVTAHNYNFTDAEPFAGVSYYRLRQVDFDGTHAFSPVRAVTIHGALAGPSLSVWPAAGGNALLIKNASAGAAIALVDITGRVLINAVSTGGDVEISMAGYAVGVYFVRAVATDDTAQTKKINWNGN
ncbi:MAG TPA: T9SS type A sorting domain-containing protein, partial [Chitinophagales bacterium]|nr:T9SS type A sorting domain-containing protein [Chitinophagales bacterium]